MFAHTCAYACAHVRIHVQKFMQTCMHTCVHACTNTRMHAHAYAHTRTHTHTYTHHLVFWQFSPVDFGDPTADEFPSIFSLAFVQLLFSPFHLISHMFKCWFRVLRPMCSYCWCGFAFSSQSVVFNNAFPWLLVAWVLLLRPPMVFANWFR